MTGFPTKWIQPGCFSELVDRVYFYPSAKNKKGTFMGGYPVDVWIMMHQNGDIPQLDVWTIPPNGIVPPDKLMRRVKYEDT
jgi:hypothetical protein